MFITRAALFFSALASAAFPAFSQTYPTRPITMIVPFAVGGPTDTIARIVGERMGKTWDNRSSSRTSPARAEASP